MSPSALLLLESATERHRQGDLPEARRLYGELLAGEPDHGLALFRSGLLELQDGKPEQALLLLQEAGRTTPCLPRLHAGLAQIFQALGRYGEAAEACCRALASQPESADVHFALGLAKQSQEQFAEAVIAYRHAVELQIDHFAAWNNLGMCLQRLGETSAAAASYTRALALRPSAAGTMANLGTVLQALDRVDEAVSLLRRALELEPHIVPHAVNLGIALCRQRSYGAAEIVLQEALAWNPDAAEAAFNLGNALQGLGRTCDAADAFRRTIALRATHADAWINLGNAYQLLGDLQQACDAYESAIRAEPNSLSAFNNAGCVLRKLGRLDAAEDMLRRALAIDPAHSVVHDTLGSVQKDAGDIKAAISSFRRALQLDPNNAATHGNLAYALSFQSAHAGAILEECRRWDQRFAAPLGAWRDHVNLTLPQRRLRIGYVSPDFRDHCQSLFMVPLLSQHDHQDFEIFCYASVQRPDPITGRIAAMADVWRDVRTLDDAALASLIRDDGIDILVDLTMHMARGRPLVFARKPAPIQLAWLAYPGTTGLRAMDYRISDPRLDPHGADGDYAEKTLRLPDSFWCYDPLTSIPVNTLPAFGQGHITFGCLNNPCKLSDATLLLWAAVLRAVDGSRLLVLAPGGRHQLQLSRRLDAAGIATERVAFVPYRDRARYLETYHEIDLGLDTVPYNGHTTSLDALWMGVPTVTRVGTTCAGRAGLSQLYQLGLTELAADTDLGFIETAVALANDVPRLSSLRQQLRSRLEASPLMDATRFARNMETLYRGMWKDYCRPRSAGE